MSREMRTVPKGWEHPRGGDGRHRPLNDQSYREACTEQAAFWTAWANGGEGLDAYDREACEAGEPATDYAPYIGHPDEYRPDWGDDERTCFVYYETVSEGTPVSPVFETIEGLAEWLAKEHGGTYERWLENLQHRGGFCPSGLGVPGVGIMLGVDAIAKGHY